MKKIFSFSFSLLTAVYFLLSVKIPILAQGIIGSIPNPTRYTSPNPGGGLFLFMSNIFKLAGTIGGLFLVFKLVIAGFDYLTADGDAKKTSLAWAKIWQSLLGLIIIASAFVIAGVAERITGIKILNPTIYGP